MLIERKMDAKDLIFVTSGYKVLALKKSDGLQVWETTLITKFFKPAQPFITMLVEETGVYVHTLSDMFRLDLATGAIVWKQQLARESWTRINQISSLATLGASNATAVSAAKMAGTRRAEVAGD
jgi:outer membrane protein assembly factor BamB